MSKKYSNALFFVILVFVAVVVYSRVFSSPFYFDDNKYIVLNKSIRDICSISDIWNFYPTRIITFFTFALNYNLSQLDVYTYHLFNIIIHLGSAILIWQLIRLIFSISIIKRSNIHKYSSEIAFFTALIFLSHPVQTQSVTYIWQRCASLAGLFYLLSVYFYIRTRIAQVNSKPISRWAIFYASSYFFCIMAMFTKENALSLPFMIILCEACFFKRDKRLEWKYALYFLFMLLIIPSVLFFTNTRPSVIMDLQRYTTHPLIDGGKYFLTQFRVMLTYIRIMFLPLNQNLDYDYPMSKGFMSADTLGSLFILVFIIITAVRLFKKYPLLSFGVFWFFLTVLSESSIMPLDDVIFEHRLYLPTAGYSLFFVSGLYYIFQEKRARFAIIVLSIFVVLYSTMTYERNKVWRDEVTLWNDTVRKSPNKARPYQNRANVYHKRGEFEKAIADYNRALVIDPGYYRSYYDRGNAYYDTKDFDKAISDYNMALQLCPNLAEAYNNRGLVYHKKGDIKRAISDYNKALEINSGLTEAYNNRKLAYQDQVLLSP